MKHLRLLLAATLMAALGLTALGATTPAAAGAVPNTDVTLKIANCEGCLISATSVMASDYEDIWQSPTKKVKDGEVTLKVPADRTAGLSVAINAPWEGHLPYQTMLVFRYKGYAVGDKVSYSDIDDAKRAAGCWAGTTESAVTMKVVVKKVKVMGHFGPVKGSIAFTKVTQDYLKPLQRVYKGVLGTQDVFGCGPLPEPGFLLG